VDVDMVAAHCTAALACEQHLRLISGLDRRQPSARHNAITVNTGGAQLPAVQSAIVKRRCGASGGRGVPELIRIDSDVAAVHPDLVIRSSRTASWKVAVVE